MSLAGRYPPLRVVDVPYADDGLDEDAYKKKVGAVITELRLARGIKRQPDLAVLVNVSPRTVSRWENGHTAPTAWDLRTLSDQLRVPVGVFLDPPTYLDLDELQISYAAEATLRREMLKRQARRRRGDETPF